MPLLQPLEVQSPAPDPPTRQHDGPPPKRILLYAPLAATIFLIILPHPSFIIMLVSHYLKTLKAPVTFWIHLLAVYILTLLAFTSMMVCVVRDPGSVNRVESRKGTLSEHSTEEQSALLSDSNPSQDETESDEGNTTFGGRWCRRCHSPRPERAHHCSVCGRCVLKMDHHCPWLGGSCIGFRTYPSFLHFLLTTASLASYIACVALSVTVHLISHPFSIDPRVTPLHALFLVLMGAIFSLTIGSFLIYHLYLVSTNQTTLEHMSPFLLLRYLPALPSPAPAPAPQPHIPVFPPILNQPRPPALNHSQPSPPLPKSQTTDDFKRPIFADPPTPPLQSPLSSPLTPPTGQHPHPLRLGHPSSSVPYSRNTSPSSAYRDDFPYRPPEEHELSGAQRRTVQYTAGRLRLYDLGFRRNWRQVFGGGRRGWQGWCMLVLWGGSPRGGGRVFEKRTGVRQRLERLAIELEDIKKHERR